MGRFEWGGVPVARHSRWLCPIHAFPPPFTPPFTPRVPRSHPHSHRHSHLHSHNPQSMYRPLTFNLLIYDFPICTVELTPPSPTPVDGEEQAQLLPPAPSPPLSSFLPASPSAVPRAHTGCVWTARARQLTPPSWTCGRTSCKWARRSDQMHTNHSANGH